MGSLKALTLAGGVALAASTVAARAADLLPPPPPPEAPIAAPVEFSGWYLRGDVGVGVSVDRPKLRTSPDPLGLSPNGCDAANNCTVGTYTGYGFHQPGITQPAFVGAGVGYQINNWLRADATIEWRGGAHLSAVDTLTETGVYTPNGGAGQPYTRTVRNFYKGNVSSIVAMVNGYVDLGTFWGVTPYVGVGLGVAHNRLSGLTDNGFVYTTTGAGVTGSPTGGYFLDGRKTNFAWALMAGLGYSVSQNLKLELGYRYMNLGKVTSGASRCFGAVGFSACDFKISSNRVDSHDVRLGMRWMLGGAEAAPPPPAFQAPALVRKY